MSRYERTTLGTLVLDRRTELGLTQEDVSKKVGMSQEWTSLLERGRIRQPRILALQRLAKVLELPLDRVLMAAGLATSGAGAKALAPEDVDHPDLVALVEELRQLPPETWRQLRPMVDGLRRAHKGAGPNGRREPTGSRR